MAADRVAGHLAGLIQRATVGNEARQKGNSNLVTRLREWVPDTRPSFILRFARPGEIRRDRIEDDSKAIFARS